MNGRTRVWSAVVDQVFSSASNGIFTFAVAVASSTRSFGEIVLMITALTALLGAQRGAVGTPLLLKSDQTTVQIRREGSHALLAGLVVGCVVLGVMVVFGYALGLPAVLLAVAAPIVLCQDILRYVAISDGRPQVAATWDGVWFLGTVLLLVSAWLRLSTVPWLIGGWAGLGLIALIGMAADLRMLPRLDGFGRWLRAGWQHRVRYGIDAGLEQTNLFLVLGMVTAVLSPAATAALRGATLLLAPIGILVGALQLVVISEATRNTAQPRTVWYASLRWFAGVAALAVAGGVVLYSLPGRVGGYVLGQSFGPAQHVLPIIVIEYCASVVAFALCIFLKTFNRSLDVLRFKIAWMTVTLVTCTGAALLFRSASGVAVGLAVGSILVTSLGLAYYAPWEARTRASSVDITAGAKDLGAQGDCESTDSSL
ncbi:hypothetical protein OQ968_03490 [Mycobacterium sp. 663a-19]|uniref:hypothetical protein n=1 Tax=Mycobacterium sp. 663a-19 TaxID=2986148 RepID=UPI002D1F61AA|nr:hypothetical protein [Mycobacterium sp. 663a-19]MEB3980323.1 hypothetical protein [Mycobacterium sp. 663a-19]